MRKNKYLFEKLGLRTFDIIMRDGTVYKNYPLRGDNLSTPESVREFLVEHEEYILTLGNNKKVTIRRDEVKEIR